MPRDLSRSDQCVYFTEHFPQLKADTAIPSRFQLIYSSIVYSQKLAAVLGANMKSIQNGRYQVTLNNGKSVQSSRAGGRKLRKLMHGVYIGGSNGQPVRFRQIKAPNTNELNRLTHTIAHRVARYLVREGLLESDSGNIYLTPKVMAAVDEDLTNQLLGSSVTYRIAVGPQQGRKVFTLQTLPDLESDNPCSNSVGEAAGFSLHGGVATKANERMKLERLCRYITRPAVAAKRMSLTRNGQVRYELKTPWRNGTTHVIFEPLDFVSRLVSLVPKPRVNLTRFHGVFAPNSKYRSRVTPARRGKCKKTQSPDEPDRTPAEKRASMTWAKRLKRVFDIDKVN